MKTAVMGTGMVGRTLAARLVALGHAVELGTRDPEATLTRAEPDAMGNARSGNGRPSIPASG